MFVYFAIFMKYTAIQKEFYLWASQTHFKQMNMLSLSVFICYDESHLHCKKFCEISGTQQKF